MLNEIKLALGKVKNDYDAELARLALAAVGDLGIVDVRAAGVTFAFNQDGSVTDSSTITDQLLIRAIITYVKMHFKTPEDYDKLERSYNEQKAQLISASGYGLPAEVS
jgi:hypothetical protein